MAAATAVGPALRPPPWPGPVPPRRHRAVAQHLEIHVAHMNALGHARAVAFRVRRFAARATAAFAGFSGIDLRMLAGFGAGCALVGSAAHAEVTLGPFPGEGRSEEHTS